MSCNQAGMDTIYMESFIQGQPSGQNNWYEYTLTNTMIPVTTQNDSQLIFEQDIGVEQPHTEKSKALPRNPKRSTVGADRSYFCHECGTSFSNSSNLKSHSRIHSGERPYVCDFCGAAFVQSSNMKAHKRIHTGERPFMCTECGQTFSRSSHLTGHKRTHTGERPYICGVCHEAFVTSTHLRNHMRKHTGEKPFTCKICQLSFSQNGSLQIHLRIHTGERPFKCANCNSAFRSKGDLRSHYKLHTDLREYVCFHCNKTFKTKQYLQKHTRKCGTPPTGKKRGRPKKQNVAGIEKVLSKSEGPVIINCNKTKSNEMQIINCSSSKGNRIRHKVRTGSLGNDIQTETNPDGISLDPLKVEISDENNIPMHQYIELSEDNKQDLLYLGADTVKTMEVHSNGITKLGLSSFSCNSETSHTLVDSRIEASASSSMF